MKQIKLTILALFFGLTLNAQTNSLPEIEQVDQDTCVSKVWLESARVEFGKLVYIDSVKTAALVEADSTIVRAQNLLTDRDGFIQKQEDYINDLRINNAKQAKKIKSKNKKIWGALIIGGLAGIVITN